MIENRNRQCRSNAFLEINPALMKYRHRFIYGTTEEELRLFFMLCSFRIPVDGFVDDDFPGEYIYKKAVYKTKRMPCKKEECILICLRGKCLNVFEICAEPLILNKKLNRDKIYIYGAGNIGRQIYSHLKKHGIDVLGFIDSDTDKIGTTLCDKMIFGKDIIERMDDDTSIIEAGRRHREIDREILMIRTDIQRFYCEDREALGWNSYHTIEVDRKRNIRLIKEQVNFLNEFSSDEKIVLYGDDPELAYSYYQILKLFDFADVCIVSERELSDPFVCRIPFIEELLYEKDFVVLIYAGDAEKYSGRLETFGIKAGKALVFLNRNFCRFSRIGFRKQIWDVNLGYTYIMNASYPGIYVFGEEKNGKDNCKIAILGGSTSDSGAYSIKSWVQIFYERYCRNKNITVYNGAVVGYNSAQELIKLMRDIVYLKPDIVIAYDGYNDVEQDYEMIPGRWGIPYVVKAFQMISEDIMDHENLQRFDKSQIFAGEGIKGKEVETWLTNVRYMQMVSEMNGIRFYDFIQPSLLSKESLLTSHEIALLRGYEDSMKPQRIKTVRQLRQKGREISKQYDFIYDLSHIFDNEDVYADYCHVYERGNEIIADEIYRVVKNGMDGVRKRERK